MALVSFTRAYFGAASLCRYLRGSSWYFVCAASDIFFALYSDPCFSIVVPPTPATFLPGTMTLPDPFINFDHFVESISKDGANVSSAMKHCAACMLMWKVLCRSVRLSCWHRSNLSWYNFGSPDKMTTTYLALYYWWRLPLCSTPNFRAPIVWI